MDSNITWDKSLSNLLFEILKIIKHLKFYPPGNKKKQKEETLSHLKSYLLKLMWDTTHCSILVVDGDLLLSIYVISIFAV